MIYEPATKGLHAMLITSAILVTIGLGLIMFGMFKGEDFKIEIKNLVDQYGNVELQYVPTSAFAPLVKTVEFSSKIIGIGSGLTIAGSTLNLVGWYFRWKMKKKLENLLKKHYENLKGEKL